MAAFGSGAYGSGAFSGGVGTAVTDTDDQDIAVLCAAPTADADIDSLCSSAGSDADIDSLCPANSAGGVAATGDAVGTVYLVDYVDGSDANDGITAAWQTATNINGGVFVAGDEILFKRGVTFRDLIDDPPSGDATNPIIFGAYGTGTDPILSGADVMTGWASISADRWTVAFTNDPKQVFFDGVRGAEAASQAAVAAPLDWFWTANTLTVFSVGTPTEVIEAPVSQYAFREGTADFIQFEDLFFEKSWEDGLGLFGESNYTALRCTARQNYRHGFKSNNMSVVAFTDCVAYDNQNGFSCDDTTDLVITSCTSRDNATPDLAIPGDGINIVRCDGFSVTNCTIFGHDTTISSDGMQVVDCIDWTISGCSIYGSGNADIICQDSAQTNYGTIKECTFGSAADGPRYHVFMTSQVGPMTVTNCTFVGNPTQSATRVNELQTGAILTHKNNTYNTVGIAFSVRSAAEVVLANIVSDFNVFSQIISSPGSNLIFWPSTTYTGTTFSTYQSVSGQDANSGGS